MASSVYLGLYPDEDSLKWLEPFQVPGKDPHVTWKYFGKADKYGMEDVKRWIEGNIGEWYPFSITPYQTAGFGSRANPMLALEFFGWQFPEELGLSPARPHLTIAKKPETLFEIRFDRLLLVAGDEKEVWE